jgi:hypothetical protein
MKRISEYDNITTVSENDVVPIVDVSDTEQASTGSTRKGTIATIADYLKDRVETLTGKTLTSPKINEDVTVTATSTELNKLDGVTADTSELNILDGVTATATELNQLDDVEVGGNTSGDIVTTDDTQSLSNKSLTSSALSLGDKLLRGNNDILEDDSAASFTPDINEGALLLYCRGAGGDGVWIFMNWRLSAAATVKYDGHANALVSTSALAGTTGTDGKFTVSSNGGKLYFENRLGSTQYFSYIVLGY